METLLYNYGVDLIFNGHVHAVNDPFPVRKPHTHVFPSHMVVIVYSAWHIDRWVHFWQ
jgi:hypothetical protein